MAERKISKRFEVTKPVVDEDGEAVDLPDLNHADANKQNGGHQDQDKYKPVNTPPMRKPTKVSVTAVNSENSPFIVSEMAGNADFSLFEDDQQHRPKVAQMIKTLSGYTALQPGTSDAEKKARKAQGGAKMGTFMGVYLPCVQNIFGVLFFIRLVWIVGTAGVLQGFFIVFICCCVTFLTSISLSAIATNGMVPGGGPYYMISRNLGPELGGAVGILFYLGTSVAGSMYIIGAVEIFVAKIFENIFHCYRLFGTIFLLTLGLIVMAGVRVVNKFALPAVFIVVLCIFLTFVGVFVKVNGSNQLSYCMVGDRIANVMKYKDEHGGAMPSCNATSLEAVFCHNGTACDEYFLKAKEAGTIRERLAIKGLASGVITENFYSKYMQQGRPISQNTGGSSLNNGNSKYLVSGMVITRNTSAPPESVSSDSYYVFADITSSFMILVGVFFPSCTGIMAGSNRSGDLKDASMSIPRGTIAATLTTSVVYLSGVVLFGASVDEMFIRDKFGEGAFGKLVVAELAVPHPMLILIGCFMSTIGAGMQSLTGAPRLFQAIAKDGVIPVLAPFEVSTRHGEPWRAILLTLCICELGVLIAQMESITALITQFFLMCYLSVNAACALQSLLKSPGWRPRFKYYHPVLSMFGAGLCVAVMFISHWGFAILSILIGVIVYKYIEFRGAEKEWGDGLRGLGLSAARFSLLNLEGRGAPHTKNWRPQLLVLCAADLEGESIRHERLMAFVSQLKAGRGLTVLASVIQGEYTQCTEQAEQARVSLKTARDKYKIKGFCEVLVCKDITDGISSLIQTSGLGVMKHNTVIQTWPDHWRDTHDWQTCHRFVDTVRMASAAKCAILVPKHVDNFPDNSGKIRGYMDIWWVVHDGGMLMLLPFLLRQHRTWRNSILRIFTVAQMEDNSVKMKEDLETFLYHLRITAQVDVIEMPDSDISEYTYERTLVMEQRAQIMKDLRLSGKERNRDIQMAVMDKRKMSQIEDPSTYVQYHGQNQLSVIPETHRTSQTAPSDKPDDTETVVTVVAPPTPTNNGSGDQPETVKEKKTVRINENVEKNGPSTDCPTIQLSSDAGDASPSILSPRTPDTGGSGGSGLPYVGLKPYNVRKMHTAMRLNEIMKGKSAESELVIVNLPGPPKQGSEYYMEFIEALTDGLDRILLVKGTGAEVVTIYS